MTSQIRSRIEYLIPTAFCASFTLTFDLLTGFQYALMIIQKWLTFYWATNNQRACSQSLVALAMWQVLTVSPIGCVYETTSLILICRHAWIDDQVSIWRTCCLFILGVSSKFSDHFGWN